MRVTVANLKGGPGKTTTAVFLALALAETGRTLLVDADPQRSALGWSEDAADAGQPFPATVIPWATRDLAARVRNIQSDYTHTVIDTAPGRDDLVRQALMVSDLLIVPLSPKPMEAARLGPTFELAGEVESMRPDQPLRVRVLLTKVKIRTTSAREVRTMLTELDVPTFDAVIRDLESYGNAYGGIPSDFGEYADVLKELQSLEG